MFRNIRGKYFSWNLKHCENIYNVCTYLSIETLQIASLLPFNICTNIFIFNLIFIDKISHTWSSIVLFFFNRSLIPKFVHSIVNLMGDRRRLGRTIKMPWKKFGIGWRIAFDTRFKEILGESRPVRHHSLISIHLKRPIEPCDLSSIRLSGAPRYVRYPQSKLHRFEKSRHHRDEISWRFWLFLWRAFTYSHVTGRRTVWPE